MFINNPSYAIDIESTEKLCCLAMCKHMGTIEGDCLEQEGNLCYLTINGHVLQVSSIA